MTQTSQHRPSSSSSEKQSNTRTVSVWMRLLATVAIGICWGCSVHRGNLAWIYQEYLWIRSVVFCHRLSYVCMYDLEQIVYIYTLNIHTYDERSTINRSIAYMIDTLPFISAGLESSLYVVDLSNTYPLLGVWNSSRLRFCQWRFWTWL